MNKKGTQFGEPQPPLHKANISNEDNIDLFLLAGQSNMKGRAKIEMNPDQNKNTLFFHSKELSWFIARDPLHAQGTPDLIDGKDNSGTGPAMSFARTLTEHGYNNTIGFIPSAVGGAPIDTFSAEGDLYIRSLKLYKQSIEIANANCKLKAILWLQGESDSTESKYQGYESKLLDLVDRYRRDLNMPELPFIACTIGSFLHKGDFLFTKEINLTLLNLPKHREYTLTIDARDIESHNGDAIHYDYDAQIEIGKRFAAAYHSLSKKSI